MPQSATLYRRTTGDHLSRLDKQQGDYKKQNEYIQQVASRPGNHSGNKDRQLTTSAAVQLLSVLSSVHNTPNNPAITSARADELAAKGRIVHADNLYRGKIIERMFNRAGTKDSGQNFRRENAPKTQGGSFEQRAASPQRGEFTAAQPVSDQIQSHGSPLSAASHDPAFVSGTDLSPSTAENRESLSSGDYYFGAMQGSVANALHNADEFISRHDPLRFPEAIASPLPSAGTESTMAADIGITRDLKSGSYIISGEQKKTELISSLVKYLVSEGQVSADECNDFELWLRSEAAGMPVLAASLENEGTNATRTKRAVIARNDPRTAEHIKGHCAFEEEVLNAKGENEGKLLLFQAQRAENPFRMIYDNTDGSPSPEVLGVADGLNIAFGIVTFGILPLIGKLIANAKRREYHQKKGDEICAERFRRLFIAELATSIDADGLTFASGGRGGKAKPTELLNASPAKDRAAFYTRDPHTGIRKEILFELKQGKGAINDNGSKVYLKPTEKPNEFVTYHPDAVNPVLLERRVIVDENSLSWRYAGDFDSSGLNVDISEGKRQIKLHGENYELQKNGAGKYEIVVQKKSGVKELVPVYMDPLSRTWHMSTHNKNPVFLRKQEDIINRISVKQDYNYNYFPELNNNPQYYGAGKTYRKVGTGDAAYHTQGRYVEMAGQLLPVRQKVTPGHGVRYEIYDMKNTDNKGWPIEWDGARWLFERSTSVHVSKKLKEYITSEMFSKNVGAGKLSAPDNYGLRWDGKRNTYLKIRNKFIKVSRLNDNRFSLNCSAKKHYRTILRFKNNKFAIETTKERLKNILETGLGGRKRKTAVSVLKEQSGFTESSSKELLEKYKFPEDGFYSDYMFALDVEQTGKIPTWADMFKKRPRLDGGPEEIMETVSLMKPDFPQHKIKFNLGKTLGDGAFGEVYTDVDDKAFVIKRFYRDEFTDPTDTAMHEAEMFNRYYGEGAATVLVDESTNVYLRMYRVPGETLDSLAPGSLPSDAEERFVDMIEKLNHLGIVHNDIHGENILWDDTSQAFFPIDINNARESYFNAHADAKAEVNKIDESEWYNMLELIGEKKL